jgi:hypothetical protein
VSLGVVGWIISAGAECANWGRTSSFGETPMGNWAMWIEIRFFQLFKLDRHVNGLRGGLSSPVWAVAAYGMIDWHYFLEEYSHVVNIGAYLTHRHVGCVSLSGAKTGRGVHVCVGRR